MFSQSDFIDSNYHIPEKITAAAQPKNLILIFAESLERDFARDDIFAENLIPHLSAEKGLSFRGYESLSGTGWTIAAQFAALCGIPLKDYHANDMKSAAAFFPNAVCVPDVLKKSGYTNAFFKGASLQFSGTEKLLVSHNFDIAQGWKEFIWEHSVKPEQWQNGWGLTDKEFLQLFKRKLTELSEQKKPFFAVGETVDTHFDTDCPRGTMTEYCPVKYKDMRDVIKCADTNLSDFINWYRKQSFAQNTVLVILGDHPMMQSNIQKYINTLDRRETYNIIIGEGIKPATVTKIFTQVDWAPTLLELTGHIISESDKRQFGLGVSLLSNNKSIAEKYGIQKVNAEMYKRSKLYDFLQNSR